MFDLNTIRDFVAVVREESYSGAARSLGTPKSTVSKRIQDLEAALKTRLIERTTRALRLTPEGMAFHARALRILAEVEEAESLLQARSDEPSGRLRISAPLLFGQAFMGGIAAAYRARCPKVAIEVVLVDRRVDLIEEGFDAAIRVGELPDSNLVFRKFAEVDQVVVATPEWICDTPVNSPSELSQRPCLAHSVDAATRSTWRLMNGTEAVDVNVTPVIKMSSLVALRDAALAGAGFAFLPRFMVTRDIEEGRLVHAHKNWVGVKAPVSIVYPSSRFLSARLRAFIDLLIERFPEGSL
jgi:DNA-binding transcriptional LysR family regulator